MHSLNCTYTKGVAMFERFTDRARRLIVLAQEEARLQNCHYIGTEHLLLSMGHASTDPTDLGSVAYQALALLGFSLQSLRGEVQRQAVPGTNAPSGHIPFTPRAKKVLELSLREALQLDHNYIGAEHVLLALCREGEGLGMKVLASLNPTNGDPRVIRQQVMAILFGGITIDPDAIIAESTIAVAAELLGPALDSYANILVAMSVNPADDSGFAPARALLAGTHPRLSSQEVRQLRDAIYLFIRCGLDATSPLYDLYRVIAGGSELQIEHLPTRSAPSA